MADTFIFLFLNLKDDVSIFMERGGPVLNLIAGLLFLMWLMVLERVRYFWFDHKRVVQNLVNEWNAREDHHSWYSKRIREDLLSQGKKAIQGSFPMIETCVIMCPLLGLLGTVTGMMDVFHIMGVTGGGDVKAMAGGVSRSTIPTMSGMVGALSGVIATTLLKVRMTKANASLESKLETN